jgi:DHA1 family bicyclomycin/chloramphenicol resistance-like MFS transporter
LLGVLTAFGPFAIDMYLPAFSQITRDLAARPGMVQLTLAAFLLSSGISQVLYGLLSDRYGRRRPLLAGCALYALGSLGCALAPSLPLLILGRVVQALGGAAGMVIARAVVRDFFDERASARVFSELMLVMGVAPIVAPTLGGQILAFGSWRLIFCLLTVFGGFCFLATFFALPESLPQSRRSRESWLVSAKTFLALLENRRFLGYCLVTGFCAGTMFAYIAGSPFIYMDLYGVSVGHFGLFFGLNALGLMASTQINYLLLRKHTPETILFWSTGSSLFLSVLLVVAGATGWGGLPALAGILFFALFCVGLSNPNLMAVAMAPFGREAGRASAMLGAMPFAMGALAGAMVGVLHNGTALPMTLTLAVCSAGAFVALRTLGQRPGDEEPEADPITESED